MSRTETIVWTALPNGIASANHVNLSVFVTPQLMTTEGGKYPLLSLFPDFVNWPTTLLGSGHTIPPLSFTVTFEGHPAVTVTPTLSQLSAAQWAAIFNPATTWVQSWTFEDVSTTPIHTFDVNGVLSYVSTLYGKLGLAAPILPPVLTTGREGFQASDAALEAIYTQLLNLAACAYEGYEANLPPGFDATGALTEATNRLVCAASSSAIGAALGFHVRPPLPTPPSPPNPPSSPPFPFVPTTPTLDFHQAVSSLGEYGAVLRNLGLAFDLVVPLPAGLTNGTVNVSVTPTFHTAFPVEVDGQPDGTMINVTPQTICTLTKAEFRAVPAGPDYGNGMLDLADTTRFSVVDLDVDGAAEQLNSLSKALNNYGNWVEPQAYEGQTMAMTVPALRSTGPSIVWSGWATPGSGLNELTARQAKIATDVQNYVTYILEHPTGKTPPALPTLYADDIIRGHRFDVLPESDEAHTWRSLHQRIGTYVFGSNASITLPAVQDEGTSTPGATTAAGIPNPPPDLYVHEEIVRWPGWSLAAQRPGQQIDPDDLVGPQTNNPADPTKDVNGLVNPQLSASFTVVGGTLPKLRFGNRYRYRARAVDLADNSLPVTSTDASTATEPAPHYRYQPVPSPVIADTAPLGPGEATLLLAIRNYQTTPATAIVSNGRWLFPPKASELLAEEHGMLDGFRAGFPPRRNEPPNGNAATFDMLAGPPNGPGRVDATLADLPGALTDAANNSSVYFPSTADPTTPWLPDPLSRGASISGYPGALEPAVRHWLGGPWPDADPLLLLLENGAAVGHTYTPGSPGTPSTEQVTLPPGDSLDLGISSALTSPLTLGVFWWMESQAVSEFERLELLLLAERGQLWMLSPYKVLRLVHAVRIPLVAPVFANPQVTRNPNAVQATIVDTSFVYDGKSTADIDAEAVWTDPVDDPSDLTNDPATDTITTSGHAFKTLVPDPGPLNATDRPMEVFSPPVPFEITSGGVIHTIGDTLHHDVNYTCTGTSRFAEFFLTSVTTTLTTTATTISELGFDLTTLVVTTVQVGSNPVTTLVASPDGGVTGDYIATPAGTLALTTGSAGTYTGQQLVVTYVPTDISTGAAFQIHILSTSPPKAPKVARVTPAWSNSSSGEIGSGITFQRVGGFVRVYIERPWFSTGAGELLGVVGVNPPDSDGTQLPPNVSAAYVTTMGLDPISVSSLDQIYPIAPTSFGSLATVPSVPYRPAYTNPPLITLLENQTGPQMAIWPYEVNFDPISNYWYADVAVSDGEATDGPPPGWFIRLALVRFQPWSIPGAEISQVSLATFCQPVPDRTVSVTQNTQDSTDSSVIVTVTGPGYYGWRPPNPKTVQVQDDWLNEYALQPNSTGRGAPATSTIVVEVQVQDTSTGLTGDLSWVPWSESLPFPLEQSFQGSDEVTWNTPLGAGGSQLGQLGIPLPYPLTSSTPMRLRISELDYFPFNDTEVGPAPAAVNTTFRRPFVVHIPIN